MKRIKIGFITCAVMLSNLAFAEEPNFLKENTWQQIAKDQYFAYSLDPKVVFQSNIQRSPQNTDRILDAPIKIVTLKDLPKYDYHKKEMAIQHNSYNCSSKQFSIGRIQSYTADETLFEDDPATEVEWLTAEKGSPSHKILDAVCSTK